MIEIINLLANAASSRCDGVDKVEVLVGDVAAVGVWGRVDGGWEGAACTRVGGTRGRIVMEGGERLG
jgi:hypothetical protein